MTTETTTCPSCSALITEKFCANCGEKKISEHDFSLKHFIEEGIEGFTHFDNKFLHSLKLLISKPGLLSLYYFQGRRVPYMKPLQLFIVCNLLFFFLLGHVNLFSLQLEAYKIFAPYTNFGTAQLIARKAASAEQLKVLNEVFNEKIAVQSKAFIIFFIPVFAINFSLLYFNKKKYFTEHLVFATHFFSFILLYFIVFRFLVETPFALLNKHQYRSSFDFVSTLLSMIVIAVFCVLATKRFYKVSTTRAIASSLVVIGIFIVAIYGYRMLLFYKIMYSIQ